MRFPRRIKAPAKQTVMTSRSMIQRKSKPSFFPYLFENHHIASSSAMAPPWLARPPFQGMKISQKPFQLPRK